MSTNLHYPAIDRETSTQYEFAGSSALDADSRGSGHDDVEGA